MKTIPATVAYPGGEPREGKYGMQISASFFIADGEKVYVNSNAPGSQEALALQALSQGQAVTLIESRKPSGKMKYQLLEDGASGVDMTTATGSMTLPAPKKDKTELIEAEAKKVRYFLDYGVEMVTALVEVKELTISDDTILKVGADTGSRMFMGLKGKI